MKKLFLILGTLLLSTGSLFVYADIDKSMVVTPIVDATVEYPASALRRHTEGYVTIRFDISENGKARNITIVDAYPDKSFNSAVKTAVRRSVFEVYEDGNPITETGVTNVERVYHFTPETSIRNIGMN